MDNYNIFDNLFFLINEDFESDYNNWNKIDRSGYFVLAETSTSFESIGLNKQNIVIDKSKLLKIIHKHLEMNDDIIKKLPGILKNPIMILKSQSVEGRIVVFGSVFDNDNNPVMVALELNPHENSKSIDKIYKVASAYGKKNIDSIKNWLSNKNNILFVDNKKRTIDWLNGLRLQLPVPLEQNDSLSKNISVNDNKVNVMIKDIPKEERPRERAIKYGVSNLSNEDLLSIILKTGTRNYSVKALSSKILSSIKSINDLKDITINSLTKINGIGIVKATELLCSLELGKRVYYNVSKDNIKLNNSKVIFEYFKDLFINEKQENFYAIYLDAKSKLISYKLLFKGTINTSCVHPREVFKYAYLESAYSIIVMHNHPSGDPTPSSQDKELTEILFKLGVMSSLPVVDHIIIGNNKYFSFYEYINKK